MLLEVFGVVFALWLFSRWLRIPQMLACRKVRVACHPVGVGSDGGTYVVYLKVHPL